MKTGIYWQDPKYAVGWHLIQPGYVLNLPLYRLDGVSFMSKDARGHLCTVSGALWTPRGRSFDGVDDYLEMPDSPSLKLTGDTTVEAWTNRAKIGDQEIVVKHYNYEFELIFGPGGELRWHHGDGAWEAIDSVGADLNNKLNQWIHIVVTRATAPKEIKFYINGTFLSKGNYTKTVASSDNVVYIGRREFAGTHSYGGLIGEVRIYNRTLSSLEIQHNYLATKWRYR